MDEEVFNMSVRRFLKKLGVTAQREIELAVREQLESGDLRGDETLDATATVTVDPAAGDVMSGPGAVPEAVRARFFDKYATHGKRDQQRLMRERG